MKKVKKLVNSVKEGTKSAKKRIERAQKKIASRNKNDQKMHKTIELKPLSANRITELEHNYQKLALMVDELVFVEEHECTILRIKYIDRKMANFNDYVLIKFKGSDKTCEYFRYQVKTHPIFVQNRRKMTVYCTIEIFSAKLNQWFPYYINDYAIINQRDLRKSLSGEKAKFAVNVNGKIKNYNRWSNKIRPCKPFLNMKNNSFIFVFDSNINAWCYGKIMAIEYPSNAQCAALNIFQILYLKKKKICFTFLHELSGCISFMNRADVTDERCSVLNEYIERTSNDLKSKMFGRYCGHRYRLLVEKFMECEIGEHISFIVTTYVGFLYDVVYPLVMEIEAENGINAIKNRNEYLMPKCNCVHYESDVNFDEVKSCNKISYDCAFKDESMDFMVNMSLSLESWNNESLPSEFR